jgi:hypothetical protein
MVEIYNSFNKSNTEFANEIHNNKNQDNMFNSSLNW